MQNRVVTDDSGNRIPTAAFTVNNNPKVFDVGIAGSSANGLVKYNSTTTDTMAPKEKIERPCAISAAQIRKAVTAARRANYLVGPAITGGELVVSCILLLGAVAVYRVQSCCTYSDEATSSDDEPAGMYS